MADYTSIMDHIDRGRGIAADHLGVPFDVYRLDFNSAQNYLDQINQIWNNYNVFRRQKELPGVIEGAKVKSFIWDIISDMSPFLLGDVFIQTDPIFGTGSTSTRFVDPNAPQFLGFCLAMHAPIKKAVGVFVDRMAQVYRPVVGADANGYLSGDYTNSTPLILTGGTFSLGTSGSTPTLIPMGVNVSERWRGELYKNLPTTTGIAVWYLYLPPLPGFTFKAGDWIRQTDGALYLTQAVLEQQTGFVGNMLACTQQLPGGDP